jgi:hypothetical protein
MNGANAIWPEDPWGRILNGALKASELPVNVLDMAETAADIAHQRFGEDLHSVYLTGELARNSGREPEIIVILRHTLRPVGLDLFAAAAGLQLQRTHAEFGSCQFHVYCWEDLFPSDGRFSLPRFQLGVNSVAIAGRDLKGLIAPQKLSYAAANASIVGIGQKLSSLVQRLKAISTETRVHSTSRQFAQVSLKAAYALVMADEQVYTEDPETMASIAGLKFVSHRSNLAALVRLSRAGTLSSLEALAVADETMKWLPDLADRWLDTHNPDREEAIRQY